MKIKINKIFWGLIILIGFLSSTLIISSCSNNGSEVNTGGKAVSISNSGNNDDDSTSESVDCSLPSASSTKCSEDDEDCEEYCKKDLGLSGDSLDKCYDLPKSQARDLQKLFAEVLANPDVDELRKTRDKEDIQLICGAIKEIDSDLLEDRIKEYNSSDAKTVLGWLAETKLAVEIFKQGEDRDGVEVLELLLQKAGGGTGDNAILEGLKAYTDVADNDDDIPVLILAQKKSNSELIRFVDKEIITDEDDGLCQGSNLPDAKSSVTNEDEADQEGACVLGVYCAMDSGDQSDNEKFRSKVASISAGARHVKQLIKKSLDNGGLALDEEKDDYEEWTDKACTALTDNWEHAPSLDLW